MSTEKTRCAGSGRSRFWTRLFRRRRAGHCRGRHDPRQSAYWAEKMVERMGKELGLDNTQRASLAGLKDKLLSLGRDMWDNRADRKKAFLDLLAQGRLDQDRAMALVTEKTRIVEGRAREMIAALAGFADGLDESQRRKLVEILEGGFGGFRHQCR